MPVTAGSGPELTVQLKVSFAVPAFSGVKFVYQRAMDLEGNDGGWLGSSVIYTVASSQ